MLLQEKVVFLLIFKEEKHRHELWRHNDIKCAASLFPAKTPLFLSRRRVLIYIRNKNTTRKINNSIMKKEC